MALGVFNILFHENDQKISSLYYTVFAQVNHLLQELLLNDKSELPTQQSLSAFLHYPFLFPFLPWQIKLDQVARGVNLTENKRVYIPYKLQLNNQLIFAISSRRLRFHGLETGFCEKYNNCLKWVVKSNLNTE